MAHQHYRTKGIFLCKQDRGEADQLFTVFTQDFGKVQVLGRAIRKIKSKLRSGAELFYFSEIAFIQGKNYKTLTDALLIDKFSGLGKNSDGLETAYQIAEAVDSLVGKEQKDEKIWGLLSETFNKLQCRKFNLLYYQCFLWNLFAILGYSPQVYNCAYCHQKLLPEALFFAPSEGGVVCWQCFAELKKQKKEQGQEIKHLGKEINVETIKVLRFILTEPMNRAEKLKIEPEALKNLKTISDFLL